ncbi:MAG: L,D-transpeptidase [Thermodesulfobacteriota bacterium]
MTYGCVSLEKRDRDEVFELVPLGTPVVIVRKMLKKEDIPLALPEAGDD